MRRYRPKHALAAPPTFRPARTNAWLWLVVVLTSGFVVGTTAAFNATLSESSSVFGTTALIEPAGQTLTLSGNSLVLGVTGAGSVASGGGTVGSRWNYYWPTGVSTKGAAPTCSSTAATYTTADATWASASTSKTVTYPTTVSGVSTEGRWLCVMSFTTYPATAPAAPEQQWLSQVNNPKSAIQVGHAVQSVQLGNVGTAGTLATNDTIKLTFTQSVDATGIPANGSTVNVCVRKTSGGGNKITLGYASACGGGTDSATAASAFGNLVPNGMTLGSNGNLTATVGWSASNTIMTLTIASGSVSVSGCTVSLSATGCFKYDPTYVTNPGSALDSATDHKSLCIADPVGTPDTGICEPITTGRN